MSRWSCYVVSDSPVVQYSSCAMSDYYRSYCLDVGKSEDGASLAPAHDDEAYFVKGGGAVFCTQDNILNSVAYINQEMQLLGLPLFKYDGTQNGPDFILIINRLYDMLTLYHKTVTIKEDLETRNHRLTCETDHHHSIVVKMKRLQENTEREMNQEKEKFRQINLKYKQLCSKLKMEKEEVKRLMTILQSKDVQHKHEQKKKEREAHRLKERLHQLLADKTPDRKVGLDLMNVVGHSEGKRATWKSGPGKQEEEMYQIIINNYEERHRELMQENGELRDCLLSMQRELSSLLKHTGDTSVASVHDVSNHADLSMSSEDDGSVHSHLSITDLDEGYFQMPYDLVRHKIERTFKETCQQIGDTMKRSLLRNVTRKRASITLSKSARPSSSDNSLKEKKHSVVDVTEIERLRNQISHYKDIQQQKDLIQQSLSSQSKSGGADILHDSQLLRERENLSEQRQLFLEERSNFEKERKAFTEAAIRLGKERQILQEERAQILKQHFLNLSPFKENEPKKYGYTSRLLPATPVFSPAKSTGKPKESDLPSTTDLYRALGLSPVVSNQKTDLGLQTDQSFNISSDNWCTCTTEDTSSSQKSDSSVRKTLTAVTLTSSPASDEVLNLQAIKAPLTRKAIHRSKSDTAELFQHASDQL